MKTLTLKVDCTNPGGSVFPGYPVVINAGTVIPLEDPIPAQVSRLVKLRLATLGEAESQEKKEIDPPAGDGGGAEKDALALILSRNVGEVIEELDLLDEESLARILELEKTGKNRTTVLAEIEKKLEPADPATE